ncbi:hypothetical protein AYK25_06155 [Thermoplasmatales archaeon SM1-50]|nr:MAG: hypothetical protein AYK25_06155 [Thermoplasmatales archaeon SM1-50]
MSFTNDTQNKIYTKRHVTKKILATYLISILLIGTIIPPINTTIVDTWWNPQWNYRKLLTMNTTQISGTLVNFPVLIEVTDSDLASHAQPTGDDLAFILYSDNVTKLAHEIEYYNSGMLYAWVKIPRLSNITTTRFWMYYGNPTCAPQENITGTWDNNYVMVQHLNETGSTQHDSTSYHNDGLSTGTSPTQYGKIDGSQQYNSNDKIVINNITHSPNALTLETWIYHDNTSFIYVACKGIYSQTSTDWILYLRNNQPANQGIDFSIRNHSHFIRKGDTPVGSWFHLTAVYNNGCAALYLNGTKIGISSGWPSISNNYPHLGLGNDYLGNEGTTYPMIDVRLDELRLSKIARNRSWIKTSYNNQKDPTGFYSIGSQQQAPSNDNQPPLFGTPTPVNGSTNIPLNLSWNISISDPEGDAFDWNIACSNGQANSGENASNGSKALVLTGLTYTTIYTVWVNATDQDGSGLYTREWFLFTTQDEPPNTSPVFGTPSPENGSLDNPISLSWNISINDLEGDNFSWSIQCSNGQGTSGENASNGTKVLELSGLLYATTYTIWVNATDTEGSGQYSRGWYMFRTQDEPSNTPPVFGPPSPENDSTNQPVNLTWTIPISDQDGDVFSWTIQCSNGQTNSGENESNGTKTLALSGLLYTTTYTIWVNATDQNGSGQYTKQWYTFTTQQEPTIHMAIIKPLQNKFYFNDIEQSITLPRNTIVYGPITITAEVNSDVGIKKVEFYADGKLLGQVNETPYEWYWKPIIQFNGISLTRTIKVIAYDTDGRTVSDEINITKWRFHILPWLVIGTTFVSRLVLHTKVIGLFYNIQEMPFSISFYTIKGYYRTVGLTQRGSGNINLKHCTGGMLIGPMSLTYFGRHHKFAIGSFTFIGTPTIERIGLLQALQNRKS